VAAAISELQASVDFILTTMFPDLMGSCAPADSLDAAMRRLAVRARGFFSFAEHRKSSRNGGGRLAIACAEVLLLRPCCVRALAFVLKKKHIYASLLCVALAPR
jgi:hypothetical protein